MKKYFLGLTAIVFAIAFSAFTKPFTMQDYKLLHDPVSANIVNNPAEWQTNGSTFGNCAIAQTDIACTISLNSTRSAYFHEVTEGVSVLNTFEYANAQNPKKDYLEIVETTGLGSDRIITSITPKHFNTSTSAYETASLSTDLTFVNAKD